MGIRTKSNLPVLVAGALLLVSALVLSLASGAFGAAKSTKVVVTAGKPSELAFTLSKKSVPAGTVVFTVTNKGTLSHTFKLCSSAKGGKANACAGKVTKLITPGHSAVLTVALKKGTYEYLCTVPGHAAAGMKGDLKVT